MLQARIAILIFFSLLFALRAFTTRNEQEKVEVVQRVRQYTRERGPEEEHEHKNKKRSIIKKLFSLLSMFMPKRILATVELDLIQADIPLKAEEMMGINIAVALMPTLFAMLLLQNYLLAVIFAILGAYSPLLFIRSAKARRLQKFNDQLGDALMVMANSLRAGFSFLQTMDSISKEMTAPISKEFGRTLREMRLGTPTEEALQNMAGRIHSEDLDLIVTAVTIQRQVGGNLAQILDNIAVTISERVRIKAEVKTLTAQGRISGTIIALLPVFLAAFISFMNPSYIILLFTHPIGLALIGGAVISEFIGIMAIKKIVTIEL
ncbi:MAG: type II secretion system F family protein [Firmicutes bacterium]|nr:type II secretion system F family protein [Bacillota bacterium]